MKRALPLLLGAALAACAWAPRLPADGPCRRVYLFWPSQSGNHTSLLVRREDFPVPDVFVSSAAAGGERLLPGETPAPGRRAPGWEWLEVGYASADYLQGRRRGEDVSFWIVVRKTPGAVYVRPFTWGREPEGWRTPYTAFVPLDLPAAGLRGLLDYVAASFARDKDGRVRPPLFVDAKEVKPVYLSTRPYSFRMFCNVWALEAVRAGGVPVSTWMPGQSQVQYWLESGYRPAPACAPAAAAPRAQGG